MTKKTERLIITGLTTLCVVGVILFNELRINIIKETYEDQITMLQDNTTSNEAYKEVYEENNKILVDIMNERDELSNKLNYLESQIRLSKEDDEKYNSTNFMNKDLREYPILTIDEVNKFIEDRAPVNSPFIGKGKEFLEASKEAKLDVRYLIAHSALESSWGVARITKDKNNYYGIGAFNHNPYNAAYTFSSPREGIREGALWISENYTQKDQYTLNSMLYGAKPYCTLQNGVTPDITWAYKIIDIIY